jgi:hypothetical protein
MPFRCAGPSALYRRRLYLRASRERREAVIPVAPSLRAPLPPRGSSNSQGANEVLAPVTEHGEHEDAPQFVGAKAAV